MDPKNLGARLYADHLRCGPTSKQSGNFHSVIGRSDTFSLMRAGPPTTRTIWMRGPCFISARRRARVCLMSPKHDMTRRLAAY